MKLVSFSYADGIMQLLKLLFIWTISEYKNIFKRRLTQKETETTNSFFHPQPVATQWELIACSDVKVFILRSWNFLMKTKAIVQGAQETVSKYSRCESNFELRALEILARENIGMYSTPFYASVKEQVLLLLLLKSMDQKLRIETLKSTSLNNERTAKLTF